MCLDYQILLQLALMAKQNERPIMLSESIDHTILNVAFDYFVLNVYGNYSLSGAPTKSIAYSSLHANVIDFVGITTININIKSVLIKTHSKLIKKGNFLWLENFLVKAESNYNKGDSN